MTILARTVRLHSRSQSNGRRFLLAVMVNAMLPDEVGLTLSGSGTPLVVLCAKLADIGWRSFN